MSILIDKNTRVMTQGITGKTGMFHTQTGRAYANGKACYVAGVNPKKAATKKAKKKVVAKTKKKVVAKKKPAMKKKPVKAKKKTKKASKGRKKK